MAEQRTITADLLANELSFSTSRSSGPGGQNVNKVNTKVTLRFDVANSLILTPDEKEKLQVRLGGKLTREGVLLLSSQDKRSQLQNREDVIRKLEETLAKALREKKKRKATKPSKSAVQARIKKKKAHSEKKQMRQKLF